MIHMRFPKLKSSKTEYMQRWINLNPWNNSDGKKRKNEQSGVQHTGGAWWELTFFLCSLSGNHLRESCWLCSRYRTAPLSLTCSHPIFKYLGRWGGISDHRAKKKRHITNQVQFVRLDDGVSTELMLMLRLKLHGTVECIDTVQNGFKSYFPPPVCLSSLAALLFLPSLTAEVLACCRGLTEAILYMTEQ